MNSLQQLRERVRRHNVSKTDMLLRMGLEIQEVTKQYQAIQKGNPLEAYYIQRLKELNAIKDNLKLTFGIYGD